MANYFAYARSNYFRVKDKSRFEDWCRRRNLEFWVKEYDSVGTRYAISPGPDEDAGWPYWETDDGNLDEMVEIDIWRELSDHLDQRDIAVLVQVGCEKLRYLTGEAVAVHSSGILHRIDLDDIYDQVRHLVAADVTVTAATY